MEPFEFPQYLTQNADEDSKRLWDSLWRVVEKLKLRDETLAELQKGVRAVSDPKLQETITGLISRVNAIERSPGGGGGGGSTVTLLGQTPLRLSQAAARLILVGSGEVSYNLSSDTVKDFEILGGTTVQATVSQRDGVYVLKAGSGAANWYNSYVEVTVTGLTVNAAYNFIFDAEGCTYNESAHKTVGHYILYDANGNTLATRGYTDGAHRNAYAFTATTSSVKVRWFPAPGNLFSAGVSEATCNAIYVNKANTTGHTAIMDTSGTFTDRTTLLGIGAGITVTASPQCSVYAGSGDEGGGSPLAGKKVVVFGDSLIGIVRDSSSPTAYIAEVTGASVVNAGFGGCRMSDHPTNGYKQFSMWALAKAIAEGDWTDQEQYASSGSDYFPAQLAALEAVDFSAVDYAVIHYGTNDFGGGVDIGYSSPDTDHSTLCGALRYSVKTLLTAYPKLRIYVSLPVFRFWESGGVTTYSDSYQNSRGDTLEDVVDALRNTAAEYNLPVIDGYWRLGVNKVNAATYLSDGTHHTTVGRRRFGEYIGGCLAAER